MRNSPCVGEELEGIGQSTESVALWWSMGCAAQRIFKKGSLNESLLWLLWKWGRWLIGKRLCGRRWRAVLCLGGHWESSKGLHRSGLGTAPLASGPWDASTPTRTRPGPEMDRMPLRTPPTFLKMSTYWSSSVQNVPLTNQLQPHHSTLMLMSPWGRRTKPILSEKWPKGRGLAVGGQTPEMHTLQTPFDQFPLSLKTRGSFCSTPRTCADFSEKAIVFLKKCFHPKISSSWPTRCCRSPQCSTVGIKVRSG